MMRLINGTCLLLTGVFLGWWLHGNQPVTVPLESAATTPDSINPVASTASGEPGRIKKGSAAPPAVIVRADSMTGVQRFRQLLNQQEFDAALIFYEEALALSEDYTLLLKPELEHYLSRCLEQCGDGVFIALVDAWLASYYDDIPVLLQLAEYQRRQGFPEEAAGLMHMAMTYAYRPNQREDVTLALRRLVQSTDVDYSQAGRWIELLGFYELLETVSLDEPAFGLRRARIHRLLGESESARELLQELQVDDDGLDPKWTQALALALADTTPDSDPGLVPASAVPITPRGNHYLIETTLNDRQQVVLLIDTGASVTSLSRSSFERLDPAGYHHLGQRLFNTANGITRGDVYRTNSLVLGNTRLQDIELAVLNFESSPGVDGLLGMNVLRNYRFEIDQDKKLLHLRPR